MCEAHGCHRIYNDQHDFPYLAVSIIKKYSIVIYGVGHKIKNLKSLHKGLGDLDTPELSM